MLRSFGRLARETWKTWRSVATAIDTAPLETKEYPPDSKRTGLIAIKAAKFGICGKCICEGEWVTEIRRRESGTSLQLGCGFVKDKNVPSAVQQKYDELGMSIKSKLAEFKITEDAVLPVGTELTAAHFVPGQYVDVKGTTLGKGFQGVMKKWGFAGGNASHGASKSHRSAGSIGGCQDPGKVWKGKKMAGRMGGKIRLVHNVWVYKVDPARNLIYVKGQVPGHKGNYVALRDARLKTRKQNLPFPTHLGPLPEIGVAEPEKDPYHLFQKGKV